MHTVETQLTLVRFDLRQKTREANVLKRELRKLSDSVLVGLNSIDEAFRKEESGNRGKQIALICNWLDMRNDAVRHFTLGLPISKEAKDAAIKK